MPRLLLHLALLLLLSHGFPAIESQQQLFREYIGAEGVNVKFSDVPINSSVEFHFILSFAIDYTDSSRPTPTNGIFKPYWDTENLALSQVSSIKNQHPNVRVAMSLGGDTIGEHNQFVFFQPKTPKTWLHLDGIDIDYEHFMPGADPDTFADCIGKLIMYLKGKKIIRFASIAPFDEDVSQRHYIALWRKYGHLIDYFFDEQSRNYRGGKVLASFGTDNSGGLKLAGGFLEACDQLRREKKLHGIFIWSADDSKKAKFRAEIESQTFLAAPSSIRPGPDPVLV
ncbi:unnamed protein product [Linum tenue]|uniref:GH18 domain-containing protein n=1 Tax=Linum tenue TaxID=586396 RepID=A0AAV0QMJ1_9ROSI|nr:unnamed protein product [Linum tenue]